MGSKVVISARGQITLPAEIRKKYQLNDGDVLIIEEKNGEIHLKPAQVFQVDYYSDDQIKEWQAADALSSEEKQKLIEKLRIR